MCCFICDAVELAAALLMAGTSSCSVTCHIFPDRDCTRFLLLLLQLIKSVVESRVSCAVGGQRKGKQLQTALSRSCRMTPRSWASSMKSGIW